ncbi:HAD family hydrolase [Pedobacter sp. SYSU D00535]|uniref:HAD family hydrolase n=1 Tax=Pedobacter sp. SYSU D00535 TaxID=2810308 RepID=UPI001A975F29|nr:HAD family hydrolase [Pedobacter sp. SYSU D00535]
MNNKPDSLIFDMDGTLWDALDIYVSSWNAGLQEEKVERTVSREEISSMMGMDSQKVLNTILPDYSREKQYSIYETINRHRAQQVETIGGTLYDGVKEGIIKLSEKYKLFIVSNCPKGMITLFMKWAGISQYITDEMAYGFNSKPKSHNIRLLVEKYNLANPVYIGDTEGDRLESELAGVPFVFFSFGFGNAQSYHLKFDDFQSFTDYYLKL